MFSAKGCRFLIGLVVLASAAPSTFALLNIDGNRNQLFVFGSASISYDSNVFSDSSERGDTSTAFGAGVEYQRRAGILAVDVIGRVDYQRYNDFTDENAANPRLEAKIAKTTGRTTGDINVRAYRESRSDSAVNLRTDSWNFPVDLNLRYPVNDKMYLTSATGYVRRDYRGEATLVDYTDFSEAVDAFYVYTSKLDLSAGYRIRSSRTSIGERANDHWFNVGATGGILAKLTGTVRVGFQIRDVRDGESYNQVNAMAGLAWPVTRKLNLNAEVTRDFNTIATGASVDSTGAALRAAYSITRKLDLSSGLSYGRNDFLDAAAGGRRDTFFGYDLGLDYRMNDHFSFGATYAYFKNWSSLDFSDFDRQSFSVSVSTRY
ncbi:MAG: outer membrane beta-barrel protein [Opitutaceae bacterium]|nr:outer membrane beta-barrel protein [Opitutaceae bacterium]